MRVHDTAALQQPVDHPRLLSKAFAVQRCFNRAEIPTPLVHSYLLSTSSTTATWTQVQFPGGPRVIQHLVWRFVSLSLV